MCSEMYSSRGTVCHLDLWSMKYNKNNNIGCAYEFLGFVPVSAVDLHSARTTCEEELSFSELRFMVARQHINRVASGSPLQSKPTKKLSAMKSEKGLAGLLVAKFGTWA